MIGFLYLVPFLLGLMLWYPISNIINNRYYTSLLVMILPFVLLEILSIFYPEFSEPRGMYSSFVLGLYLFCTPKKAISEKEKR